MKSKKFKNTFKKIPEETEKDQSDKMPDEHNGFQ